MIAEFYGIEKHQIMQPGNKYIFIYDSRYNSRPVQNIFWILSIHEIEEFYRDKYRNVS